MLSSIHPLGERARHNSWAVTAAAFTIGSVGAAALVGGALGAVGSVLSLSSSAGAVAAVAGAAVVAGVLDLSRITVAGPERQVDERWIGTYRGWVYGIAFGAQLGVGVVTHVVTWTVWATLIAELLAGSTGGGVIIGAVFGAGRALGLLAVAHIDRPSRLVGLHQRMLRWASPAHRVGAAATLGVGVLAGWTIL